MEPLLTLEDETPETGALTTEGADKAVLSEPVVNERAQKANFGLKDSSPGLESLRSSIGRGDEDYARQAAAANVDLKKRELRLRIIEEVAKSRPNEGVDPVELDLIKGLTDEQLTNPDTVFESEYSRQFIEKLALNKAQDDSLFSKARATSPETTYDTMDFGQSILTRQEIARTKLQDLQSRWEQTGLWGKVGDILETVIPGKSWINIARAIPEANVSNIQLPGTNIEEKIQYLWSLPPDQFQKVLKSTVDTMAETNMTDAINFTQAALSFSTRDEVLQNSLGILDLLDVGAVATGLGKVGRGLLKGASTSTEQQVKKAVADALKVSKRVPTDVAKVAEVTGDTGTAAATKAIKHVLNEDAAAPRAVTGVERVQAQLAVIPSIARPTQVLDDVGSLTTEAASRLATKLQTAAARLMEGLGDPVQAQRLTPEALAKAVYNAKNELATEFKHMNDSVLDIVHNPKDLITNTESVSIRLGTPQAEVFDSFERAEVWAKDLYNLAPESYAIKQEGANFWIDVPRAIDETKDATRNLLITTENKTPESNSLATKLLGWLRSPAETASPMARSNRNVVALAQEKSLQFVKEVGKALGEIPRKNREDFESVLRYNRDYINPATGDRGKFYNSVGELERGYLEKVGRLPTEQEVAAYFSYAQLSDYDWILRNTIMLRDKERLGLKRYAFEYRGQFEDGEPFFTKTKMFEGKEVDHIPWGSDHLSAVFYDPGARSTTVLTRTSPAEQQNAINKLIRSGEYKVVQIADPVSRPIKEVTGTNEPIQYVVTKAFDKAELSPKQIGYAPGGHVEYKHNFWVKQPKLYTAQTGSFYEGDVTAFNFSTRAQAEKFAKRMEEGRKLLLAGNDDALAAFLEKNLPYSKSSFKALFDPDEGYFDPKNPFFSTAGGQKYSDMFELPEKTKNLSSSSYNLNDDLDRTFTGQRNENGYTIVEKGTPENPVFDMRQAELIDPTDTLARGIGQATRSRYFGDMKTHAAESFVEEFHQALKTPLEELRKAPMAALMKPDWNDKADRILLTRAQYTQRNAMTFIGQTTPFGKDLEWLKNKMADTVYKIGGQGAADWLSTSALMQSRDPLSYFRATAFHLKLGLFNPVQLFVQAQGLAHITALSPRQAPAAMSGYTLMRRLMLNDSPEILEGAANMASKLGWQKDQFKEAYEIMQRSGWGNVGREQALLDDMSDPSLYTSAVGSFLNKSTIFFTEGERMIRMASWNAAYLEFRKANKNVLIDDREIGQIMNRADTLSVNMTRASKSQMEQGIFSIPMQFSSYQFRMMDQMLGKQLTLAEKARAFGMMSALYGIPVGVSAVTGIPFYEEVRKYALENGITMNDKFLNLMIEGIPSMMLTAITGEEYNVAQRYGPGGISLIKDLTSGDKSVAEVLVGPSGQVITDMIKSTNPVLVGITDLFRQGTSYEPLVQDLINASQSISSVNNTLRMAMALNTGKYVTKNDVYLSDMSTMDAIFSGITGITPREVSDAFLMSRSLKETKEVQKEAQKEFTKYYRRGLNEGANGNKQAMEAYFKRARAYLILGDFQPNQYAQILSEAVANQGSVIERMAQRWFRDAPGSQADKRFKQTLENANTKKVN